jgi:hypothetical protein
LHHSIAMKKGLPFLILVAVALVTLAYQAKVNSIPNQIPVASIVPPAPHTTAASEDREVSRSPASQARPLEIEEVEVQN